MGQGVRRRQVGGFALVVLAILVLLVTWLSLGGERSADVVDVETEADALAMELDSWRGELPAPTASPEQPLTAEAASDDAGLAAGVPGHERSLVLRGRITDAATGAPVKGARVGVIGEAEQVHSDADGVYALPHVTPGYYETMRVEHDDYAAAELPFQLESRDEASGFDVALERGRVVAFTVVDRLTGQPLPTAVLRRSEDEEPFARADATGRFALRTAEADHHELYVEADGYVPLSWSWRTESVDPGEHPRVPLAELAWIDGLVIDEGSRPLSGADVRAEPLFFIANELSAESHAEFSLPGSASDELSASVARTDEAGRFSLPVTRSTFDWVVSTTLADGAHAESPPQPVEHPGQHLEVVLQARIRGSLGGITLRNGQPARSIRILVISPDDESVLGSVNSHGISEWEVDGLAPGAVEVRWMDDHLTKVLASRDAVVIAGEHVEVDLAYEVSVGVIAGHVRWSNGRAAPGVGVSARERHELFATASTWADEGGVYALEVPLGALYEVTATDVTTARAEDVPPGAMGVDFVLEDTAACHLKFVDASTGLPISTDDLSSGIDWLYWRHGAAERWHVARPIERKRAGGFGSGSTAQRLDGDGLIDVQLPVGMVELLVRIGGAGYRTRLVSGVPVPAVPSREPFVVTLQRGVELALRLIEASTGRATWPEGRELFLVPERFEAAARVAIERGGAELDDGHGPSSEERGGPGLDIHTIPVADSGLSLVRGLSPGRHVVLAFPVGLDLEPAAFDPVAVAGGAIEIHWRHP